MTRSLIAHYHDLPPPYNMLAIHDAHTTRPYNDGELVDSLYCAINYGICWSRCSADWDSINQRYRYLGDVDTRRYIRPYEP